MKEFVPRPNNQEGSRSPESSNPPEKPNPERSWRGLQWIAVGGALIAASKLIPLDETFYQTGVTITTLGGTEFLYGMLSNIRK
jgi:hypothetical protein